MTENEAKLKLLMEKASKKGTAALANKISEQILVGLKANNKELHNIFAELAVEVAALSRRMDETQKAPVTDFDASFGKLADSLNKDVVASLSDDQMANMAAHIGETLSTAISAINLEKLANDTVEVKGLDKMLEKLVNKIPSKIDGKVTLAYNKSAAKDYINVRLTNGDAFVDSLLAATGGRGPGLPLIKTANDVMALPVVNPDGTFIGGSSDGGISSFTYIQKDTTSDIVNYKYYGYMDSASNWCVKRVDRSTALAEFAVSSVQSPAVSPDTYSQAWSDRATIDYVDYGTAF